MSKRLDRFHQIPWGDQNEWFRKALAKYDNEMFCPVCRGLLTGLHERNKHFRDRVEREAAKMWEESL